MVVRHDCHGAMSCWASAIVRGGGEGKAGALLRLAADRCSLEYYSSSVHTAACCCAAAYSPRRARALQASSVVRSEEAAESSVQHVGDRGWQAHSSCTVRAAHLVRTPPHARTVCKCALWIDCMACDSQARHRPVGDQMCSTGDDLPARPRPAFGIATCCKLWAK